VGNRCANNQACVRGACVAASMCTAPATQCNGWCVNLQTHPFHCGRCGNACARDQVCVAGTCRPYYAVGPCTTCPCPGCRASEACCATPDMLATTCTEGGRCP
jgi:hypothetical protein